MEHSESKTIFLTDAPKMSITVLINTIKTNKNFSKLIIYSLNSLKSHLIIQNTTHSTENSVSMIQGNNKILKIRWFNTSFERHL